VHASADQIRTRRTAYRRVRDWRKNFRPSRTYWGADRWACTPGKVLVSQTVKDLVAGSGLESDDCGGMR
jgi:hypothetical protein